MRYIPAFLCSIVDELIEGYGWRLRIKFDRYDGSSYLRGGREGIGVQGWWGVILVFDQRMTRDIAGLYLQWKLRVIFLSRRGIAACSRGRNPFLTLFSSFKHYQEAPHHKPAKSPPTPLQISIYCFAMSLLVFFLEFSCICLLGCSLIGFITLFFEG